MAVPLNLTIPLKQDAQSQAALEKLAASFSATVQARIDKVMAESKIVHFARVVVIEENQRGRYIQVLTEFDGDPEDYTEFFRKELGPVFEHIFALADGAPPWEELNTREAFYEYTHDLNLKSLGTSTDSDHDRGYMFSGVGEKTVRELCPEPSPNDIGRVAGAH
jgi:hypothetical protein